VAKKKQPSSPKQAATQPQSSNNKDHTTWPDVWKTAFDNLYSLSQSGNIYGLVAFPGLAFAHIVVSTAD
jgi:hypothetical protein